jgi:hypothetical protein
VAQLPCSADSLLQGLLGKSHPRLVGAPEVEEIKKQLETLAAKASSEYHERKERERQAAEADKQAQEEARRAKEEAESVERETGAAANLNAAASQPVGMEIDEQDFDDMDDIQLQSFDRSNPKPQGGDGGLEDAQVEEWRTVLRGVARKQAEVVGQALAAKRAKMSPG